MNTRRSNKNPSGRRGRQALRRGWRRVAAVLGRVGLNLGLAALVLSCVPLLGWLDALWPAALPAALGVPGVCLALAGLAMMAGAVYRLVTAGGATGAPADPPGRLVVNGLYRWMRNPIYLGGMLVLFGVALWRRSPTLLIIAAVYVPAMHLVVVRLEEPRMERRFGQAYRAYKRAVPRWLPKRPRL